MKKTLIMLCLLAAWLPGNAKTHADVKDLVATLTTYQQKRETTPDSLWNEIRTLREAIERQTDATTKAIYQATLAHLLSTHSWQGQTYRRDTASHPDSIQEWTVSEYQTYARELYTQALQDPQLLYEAPVGEWVPLVVKGENEKIYGATMLNVVWRTMRTDLSSDRISEVCSYASLIDFYRGQQQTTAVISLSIDSIEGHLPQEQAEKALRELQTTYADHEANMLVYIRLAKYRHDKPAEARSLLQEAMDRYPQSPFREDVANEIMSLERPSLQWNMPMLIYTQSPYTLRFQVKNMKEATLRIYRVPDGKKDRNVAQVRKQCSLLKTISHSFPSKEAYETYPDSVELPLLPYGDYALLIEGKSDAERVRSITPEVKYFSTSDLAFVKQSLPSGEQRLAVVDALHGRPVPDAKVEVYQTSEDNRDSLWQTLQTDSRGLVSLPKNPSRWLKVTLSKGEDRFFPPTDIGQYFYYRGGNDSPQEKTKPQEVLFTDRSIYRPGQTVYLGIIAYTQKAWDARVIPSHTLQVTVRDANNQEIHSATLTTDSLGTAQDSLVLPEHVLPGSYRISTQYGQYTFRVEEYKRPTFSVKIDPSEALTYPLDSITVTGTATTYSGVPVAHARVCGKSQWMQHIWWRTGAYFPPMPTDTVWTDAEGRFTLKVPVDKTAEQLRNGLRLSVNLDVLSPAGETQQASASVPLCSRALRLYTHIPARQDKDRLIRWSLQLLASNDQTVEGLVNCQITQQGKTVKEFALPAGKDLVLKELKSLPSGIYDVKASAEVKGDTASATARFVLHSMADTAPVTSDPLWFYTPCDTFSVDQPAQIQVGTPLDSAWVYCMLVSDAGLTTDTIVRLSHAMTTFTIPYEERFVQGAYFTAMLYHDGQLYNRSTRLHLQKPDTKLRLHWTTFRNLVHPGESEEWRLSVKRPDGTPAKANVLLSMYDASLDALQPHRLRLSLPQFYHIPYVLFRDFHLYKDSYGFAILDVRIRPYNSLLNSIRPSIFNGQYFENRAFEEALLPIKGGGLNRRTGLYSRAVNQEFMTLDTQSTGLQMKAAAMPLSTEVGSGDTSQEELGGAEMEEIRPEQLRTNLSELAFFRPQLRTDEQGELSIAFTLPQALTSWRLQGVAHTAEMFTGQIDDTIVAQKDLMATLHLPRFLRTGDAAILTASLQNITAEQQQGTAVWEVLDARTSRRLWRQKVRFSLAPQADTLLTMPVDAPADLTGLVVRIEALSDLAQDGEQRLLPIVPDVEYITETKAFTTDSPRTWDISLDKLFGHDHAKASERKVTVEYTQNPLWIAIQALPSLTAPTGTDAFSLSTAYYGGMLALHLAKHNPSITEAVKEWKDKPQEAASPLWDKQSLSDVQLTETPWVVEAQQEQQRHERLASLLDAPLQETRAMTMLSALKALQQPDGSLAWYPGMRGNTYTTTQVFTLMARLHHLTGENRVVENDLTRRMAQYLLGEIHESLEKSKNGVPRTSSQTLSTLYALLRSGLQPSLNKVQQDDVEKLLRQLRKDAPEMKREDRALAALVLHLSGDRKTALSLMPALHSQLRQSDGYYLAYPSGSFTSIDRKIQAHVLLMEAIRELEPQDTTTLHGMKQWLIAQKRTQQWAQPQQSADAIYALWTQEPVTAQEESDVVKLYHDGRSTVLAAPESKLGYLRQSLPTPKGVKKLRVEKHSNSLSWGAVYAQYLIPSTEVTQQEEGFRIRRDLSIEGQPRVGQRVHVRYTITASQDCEFVCIRAPRPAMAEPETQRSGYSWQGGLGYYRAIHDAGNDYFVDRMPRGTYVIEEDWLISHEGTFSLSPAQVKCLYAPEFQAHTEGTEIRSQR